MIAWTQGRQFCWARPQQRDGGGGAQEHGKSMVKSEQQAEKLAHELAESEDGSN